MKDKNKRGKVTFNLIQEICLGVATFTLSTGIFANPVLDNIAAGQVSVEQSPNTTTINQTSQKAIINWQSFNIAAPETTHFQQPAGGVALNRINPAQGASQIYGRLTATGQIILVNPAGFYFAPGSFVNVGGIIASTADISNEDFLNNYYRFANSTSYHGAIINQGQIIAADNGLIALIGGAVRNDGMLIANMGSIALGSGDAFTLTFSGNQLIAFVIDSGISKRAVDHNGNEMRDGVSNTGSIYANGGQILISAKSASGVLDHAINMNGIAQTKSVYKKDGRIILSSDPKAGIVKVSGKLIASGKNKGEKGGSIDITGHNILLTTTAVLDVSGDIGGGNINIGGNYQGKGPLPNANAVVMESGAQILADAMTSGNGGNVILWSDYFTSAHGSISAQGGSESGNGGMIETSGKQYLDVNDIEINLASSHGNSGEWLLDPADLTISSGSDTNVSGSSPFAPTAASSVLNVTTLTNALASADVTVQTSNDGFAGSGNITVATDIIWNSIYALTLNAYNNIIINAAISAVNGSLNLSAGSSSNTITTNSSGTVNVKNFNLQQGTWTQVGTLPAFNVTNNFQINSGTMPSAIATFIRATGGDGTSGTPYLIADIYGLQGMGSTTTTLGQYFSLANNIDASSTSTWNSSAGFVPIGSSANPFTATFNGQNYTISNLVIYQPANNYVGLFANTSTTASLSNLILSNPAITGYSIVGSLAGNNQATVNNITINGGFVTGATSGGSNWDVGGVLGYHDTNTVTNVTVNNMTITGRGYLGGIIGEQEGDSGTMPTLSNLTINNSTINATGDFTGGIAGYTDYADYNNVFNNNTNITARNYSGGLFGGLYGGSIDTAHNTGTVNSTATFGGSVAGIVGDAYLGPTQSITNVYNSGNISGDNTVSGIVGYANGGGTISDTYNSGNITYRTYYGAGIIGYGDNITINRVYNTGTIANDGTQNVSTSESGGIAGQLVRSRISNSYNTGAIIFTNGTTGGYIGGIIGFDYHFTFNPIGYVNVITNVYNTGYVSSGTDTGAISGRVNTASTSYYNYTGAYYNSDTSGVTRGVGSLGTDPTGVASATTANMKQSATFSGWDFGSTWSIISGTSYPYLQAFYSSTPRVISGATSASGATTIGLAYNGSEIATSTTGANGALYFLEGNNLVGGGTAIPDSALIMLYYADSSSDANSVIIAPASNGSITNASLAVNTMAITGGAASNTSLASLVSGLSASDLLFSLSGNDLTLGTASSPTVSLTTDSSTTYTLNGDISTYDSNNGGDVTFNGPVTVSSDAVINLGTGDVTMASNVDGAQALEITTSGNIVISGVIGDTTAPTSLEVKGGGNTTINAARITTSGSQTYRNPVTFGANTVMTVGSGAYLGFTGNASGASQTITLAGSGNNTFTMNGGTYNFAAINVNGSGTGNTLYANSGSSQTWNITGANAGSIAALNLAFSGIQSLTGNSSSNNTFVFADGASLAGTIDGISSSKTNTMNFSSYSTPIRIALSSTYNGTITNSVGSTIANFLNMTNTINNAATNNSSITLPTSKSGTVNITASMIGYINDPFYFSNFQKLIGAAGQNNTLVLNTSAIITSNTGSLITAIIDGQTMTFENFTLGTSSTSSSTPTTTDVASIVNSPTTNSEQNTNYSSVGLYSSPTGMAVINETYTTPLVGTATVKAGAACYESY